MKSRAFVADSLLKPQKSQYFWEIFFYILLIFLTILMISLGGATRLTGSGLSIVNWKIITGIIPPLSTSDWQQRFYEYQQFPEYKILNFSMTLEEFKKIFYFEYFHRLLGRLIGLLTFVLLMFTVFSKNQLQKKVEVFFLFILVGLQGLMGWYMVKSGLIDIPQVSHYRLLAHFLLALLFLTLLWRLLYHALCSFYSYKNKKINIDVNIAAHFFLKTIINLTIIFFVIQVVFGALLAGLDGGLVSNTYPHMFGQWVPSNLMEFPGTGLNKIFDNPVFINFFHRHLGIITSGLLIASGIGVLLYLKEYHYPHPLSFFIFKFLTITLIILALLQPIIGIITILLQVPIEWGVLHQFLAVLLWSNLFCLKLLSSPPHPSSLTTLIKD